MIRAVITHNDPNDVVIKWRLTTACNLRCPYCIQTNDKKDHDVELNKEFVMSLVEDVNRLVDSAVGDSVNINLIGGECTLYDLKEIISKLHSPKLKKINVTTNFTRSAEYFIELSEYLKSRDIVFSLTVSWHKCAFTLEQFVKKVALVAPHIEMFCAEAVSHEKNQNDMYEFAAEMEKLNIDYYIDTDKRFKSNIPLFYTDKREKKTKYRYTVWYDDDEEPTKLSTKSQLLANPRADNENVSHRFVSVKKRYCTVGWNYIYIDENGRAFARRTEGSKACGNRIPVSEFKWGLPKVCGVNYCGLCGNMSLLSGLSNKEELGYFSQALRDNLASELRK